MDARSWIAALFVAIALVGVLAIVLLARTSGENPASELEVAVGSAEATTTAPPSESLPPSSSTAAPNDEATTTVAPAPEATVSGYDPVLAGEPLPRAYRPLLPRDAIRPVYQPTYVEAADSPWEDEALVIGVELGGEARAYPVSYLNHREMVVDRLSGIPILVTW